MELQGPSLLLASVLFISAPFLTYGMVTVHVSTVFYPMVRFSLIGIIDHEYMYWGIAVSTHGHMYCV